MINNIYDFFQPHFKNIKWMPLFTLLFKATFIVILLNLSDIAYHTYNNNYLSVDLFSMRVWIFNIWLLFVIIGILLINRLWIRITLLSIILFIMLLEYFYFQYFGAYLQPIAFYQAFTETDEVVISFIDEFPSMVIPAFIIFALFITIFTLKMLKHINSYRNTILGIIILASIFSISIYGTYSDLHSKSGKLWHNQASRLLPLSYHHSTDNYMRSLRYFIVGILPKKILSNTVQIFPTLPPPNSKDANISRNVIFIIGETLRTKSVGLLGYDVDTTPNLSKLPGLFYSSVYSAGTMTKTSVSALLNRVKYPGATDQMSSQKNNLFHLAKSNGFITHFYSAQSNNQLSILQNFIGRKYIDNYASRQMLNKKIKKLSTYDIALKQAIETIDFNKGNHFVVLHQRGSHSPYHKQYPKEFKKFKKTYDNTVLYTDYVLNEIISYIKSASDKPTYIIMTSDHGELLKEHGRNGHGWFFEEVYKVPFFFYAIHQEKHIDIPTSLANVQSHFDVSNLVTSLLEYDINITKTNDIYVNGSDVDALAGYLHIKLDSSGNQKSINEIR